MANNVGRQAVSQVLDIGGAVPEVTYNRHSPGLTGDADLVRGDLSVLNACPNGGEATRLVSPLFAQRYTRVAGHGYGTRAPRLVTLIERRRRCLEQQTNTITARIAAKLDAGA